MSKIANTTVARNLPTSEEMVEMLNVDVLPFFDGYDEATFSFSEKYRALGVVTETENGFVIALDNNTEVEISKAYFQFPGSEKETVLFALQQKLI
jgi:hypothetical protein